jgi:hypothetical protein
MNHERMDPVMPPARDGKGVLAEMVGAVLMLVAFCYQVYVLVAPFVVWAFQ